MIATVSSHVWWWLARASGLVAWVSAAAAVMWGLALSSKVIRKRRIPAWLLDLHRYLGTLTLVFIAVHLAALLLDTYVHFTIGDLLIPMASPWRPRAVAWGILAFDLIVVVQVTSWLMRWMPRRIWHSVHLLSFVVFAAGTAHGALAGTDRNRLVVQLGALAVVLIVLSLVTARVIEAWNAAADEVIARRAGLTTPVSTLDPDLADRLARLGPRARPHATERTSVSTR